MAVSTTGTPSTRRWRHVTSRAGVCQRSSAATHQSRSTDPSSAISAPPGVTRIRHVPPAMPMTGPMIGPMMAGPLTVVFGTEVFENASRREFGLGVALHERDQRFADRAAVVAHLDDLFGDRHVHAVHLGQRQHGRASS